MPIASSAAFARHRQDSRSPTLRVDRAAAWRKVVIGKPNATVATAAMSGAVMVGLIASGGNGTI
ncbi:MAG: hypothetical protein U5M50_06755 [Sphingobium sp.]|nr:hypothetical protein [Sphingobium sp.]